LKKKKSGKNKFLAGHQRSWVWGRHAVLEIIQMGTWPVRECYFADSLDERERIKVEEALSAHGLTPEYASAERLTTLGGAREHQGFLLRMGAFPYAQWEEIHTQTPLHPLYLMLDRMRDAHNFGALIRSAASLGATAIIVGEKEQTPVNSQVVRSSAGAVMHMPVVQVSDCLSHAKRMKEEGIALIATDAQADTAVWSCNFKRSTALVLGNEAQGICPELSALCEERVSIPRASALDSLNVAAAGAAILYESYRQKNFDN
jgi:23S rRNA (guanosine2251-2'-O)-methyltransferase